MEEERPDELTGHARVGHLTLPFVVLEAAERLAREREMTVLELIQLGFAEWLLAQGAL